MPRRKEKDARIISIYLRRRFIKELDIERGDISRGEFIEQIFRNYDREKLDMLKEIELLKRRIKELEAELDDLRMLLEIVEGFLKEKSFKRSVRSRRLLSNGKGPLKIQSR